VVYQLLSDAKRVVAGLGEPIDVLFIKLVEIKLMVEQGFESGALIEVAPEVRNTTFLELAYDCAFELGRDLWSGSREKDLVRDLLFEGLLLRCFPAR